MDNSVSISSRSLIWVLAFFLIIVLLVLVLGRIDRQKRYNQFQSLYEKLISDGVAERFRDLVKDFSENDSAKIYLIRQNLSLLEEDIPEIDYSEIYIHDQDYYFKIIREQYYCEQRIVERMNILPRNLQKYIDYLNSTERPEIGPLFEMAINNRNTDLMIKAGNGYLLVRNFRK